MEMEMAGQLTVYPTNVALSPDKEIIILTINLGRIHNCTTIKLRPRRNSAEIVFKDIMARRRRRDNKVVLGDYEILEDITYAWDYKHKIAGAPKAAPDPDRHVLRDLESRYENGS
jgi:hypothetical protein